jgi:glycosyltransferase involved in cell wall biosynthesis
MVGGGGGVNVGFVSTRLAGTDGVSLETAKLAELFSRAGHRIAYCAGELDPDGPPGHLVEEMHFAHAEIRAIHDAAFGSGDTTQLKDRISASALRLREALREFVDAHNVDLVVAQNALSLPMNIPLGLALSEEIAFSKLPAAAHHHDFFWERERFATHSVGDLLDEHFPPVGPSIRHAVISTLARDDLRARCGADSVVLPNVMDFRRGPPERACCAQSLRLDLGFGEEDIVVLQPTRVVPRKGIEHTIELARRLSPQCAPRRVRVLLSHHAGDEGLEYMKGLRQLAHKAGVDLTDACDLFTHCRADDDTDTYDLRDAYECADLVAYPSLIEGFGNAFLEAVFYRRPILVNRYPVFVADIQPLGFDVVEIDARIDDEAVAAVATFLDHPQRVREVTERNYEVASRHFSYEVAWERIETLTHDLRRG